jgi:hypothetical protein
LDRQTCLRQAPSAAAPSAAAAVLLVMAFHIIFRMNGNELAAPNSSMATSSSWTMMNAAEDNTIANKARRINIIILDDGRVGRFLAGLVFDGPVSIRDFFYYFFIPHVEKVSSTI